MIIYKILSSFNYLFLSEATKFWDYTKKVLTKDSLILIFIQRNKKRNYQGINEAQIFSHIQSYLLFYLSILL